VTTTIEPKHFMNDSNPSSPGCLDQQTAPTSIPAPNLFAAIRVRQRL
jgi:hypothetical protein